MVPRRWKENNNALWMHSTRRVIAHDDFKFEPRGKSPRHCTCPGSRPCADPPSLMGSAALFLETTSDYFVCGGDMRAWGRRKTG